MDPFFPVKPRSLKRPEFGAYLKAQERLATPHRSEGAITTAVPRGFPKTCLIRQVVFVVCDSITLLLCPTEAFVQSLVFAINRASAKYGGGRQFDKTLLPCIVCGDCSLPDRRLENWCEGEPGKEGHLR